MENFVTISLPQGISENDSLEIQNLLQGIDSVEDVSPVVSRSGFDPASILLWVQVAGGVFGVVSAALPIIQKIREIVRGKKLSGVKIKLPDGTEISVDESSMEDIETILKASQAQ